MKSTKLRTITAGAVAAFTALALAGCASSGDAGGDSSGEPAADKSISMAIVPGWNDMTDISNLYKYVLEKNGYTVEIEELAEMSTVYVAGSEGDIDAFSGSPTTIHKQYYDKYKDDLEIVGSYYDDASIYLAVPDYVTELQSLEDLVPNAALVDNTIVGIEPGSGLVATTKEKAFPDYGLDGVFELQTSSTAAMNAALKDAYDNKQPIVVAAWQPYWINSAFDLRKLEDPKGSYGDPYTLDIVTRAGFSEEQPEVANMMSKFALTSEQFNSIDNAVFQDFKPGEEQEAIAAWLEENPDVLTELEGYLKG